MNAQPDLANMEAQLEDRLAVLIDTTTDEIEQLGRTKRSLESRITALVRKRNLWQATLQTLTHQDGDPPHRRGHLHLVVTGGEFPPKPQAIAALLAEYPSKEFRLIEIRQILIERGWMADDRRSHHALEVAVRAMERRGEIERPRRGLYTLQREAT